jgi:transcriptional regulator GlxA family with amidase domain
MHDDVLTDWIKDRCQEAELVLSVCTGALLLAKAGMLDSLEATTHYGATDLLRQSAPETTIHAHRRFVDNGRVVCSAGIAAGIDMSLHVNRPGSHARSRPSARPDRPQPVAARPPQLSDDPREAEKPEGG